MTSIFHIIMFFTMGNKAVIGPGIAVGLFGYAIGTYKNRKSFDGGNGSKRHKNKV